MTKGSFESGRLDLNRRPLRPERSALTKLSYAPYSIVLVLPRPLSAQHLIGETLDLGGAKKTFLRKPVLGEVDQSIVRTHRVKGARG